MGGSDVLKHVTLGERNGNLKREVNWEMVSRRVRPTKYVEYIGNVNWKKGDS